MRSNNLLSWTIRGSVGLLLGSLLLWVPLTTSAAPILYEFSGNVTEVTGLSSATVSAGDPISGQLDYYSNPESVFYGGVSASELMVGGIAFELPLIVAPFDDGVSLSFDDGISPGILEGMFLDYIDLSLGFSPTPFSSPFPDELPLGDFSGGHFDIYGFLPVVDDLDLDFVISGSVTSLTAKDAASVPEPGSIALMVLGLIGLLGVPRIHARSVS